MGVGRQQQKRTSGPRSPGRSLNRNKSYAFAHTSASGSTSYAATARKRGLVGWRSELSCSPLRAAANEFSMETICASRDMSTASFCKLDLREKSLLDGGMEEEEDGEDGRRDEHVGGWGAGRSRAIA